MPFSPLSFGSFARSLPGQLLSALAAFPPLDEIGAGAAVPKVAVARLFERDEAPDPAGLPDFLDDAYTLGVCFLEFTDT